MYLSYLQPSEELDYMGAYKNAASLAGHNRYIFREAMKVFMSQWGKLTADDRDFVRSTLNKVAEVGSAADFKKWLRSGPQPILRPS
jgi:hypothetical protein